MNANSDFLQNNINDLADKLGDSLLARKLTVSMAESCTGGGIAEAITRIPGSSTWFEMGFVTYSNAAKVSLLGVDEHMLNREGAVSQAVVQQMATGTLKKSQADVVVAVSGIAGPGGGSQDKPVGTVWFAWASKSGEINSRQRCFNGDRQAVRRQAVMMALEGLVQISKKVSAEST